MPTMSTLGGLTTVVAATLLFAASAVEGQWDGVGSDSGLPQASTCI